MSKWPSQHYVLKQDLVSMCQPALVIRPLKTVPDIIMCRQVTARHVTRTQSWPKNQSHVQTRQRGVSYSRSRNHVQMQVESRLRPEPHSVCMSVSTLLYAQNEGPIRENICGRECSSRQILHLRDYWIDVDKFVTKICITSGKEDLRAYSPIQRNEERITLRWVIKYDGDVCSCSSYGPVVDKGFNESQADIKCGEFLDQWMLAFKRNSFYALI